MKYLLYILLLSLAIPFSAEGRTPMRHWFTSMPDSVMPLLTHVNRLDFIDYCDANMEAVVTNRMDGKSRMDTLTDDFASIRYTESTDVSMKLFPLNDTTDILCMVTTIRASVGDSRIAFYDDQWRPLEASDYFVEPSLSDFRLNLSNDSAMLVWSKMDIFFRTFHLSAEDGGLRCVLTSLDHFAEKEREEAVPYVRQEPLIYRWVDRKFVRNE